MDRTYQAVVVKVIDGDTVILDVDLGFRMWLRNQSFRLAGCNAREHAQPGGPEAAAHLGVVLPAGSPVAVTSIKDDKFGGRYDAKVALASGQDLVELLVSQQWAAAWDGVGVKPVPPWPRTLAS